MAIDLKLNRYTAVEYNAVMRVELRAEVERLTLASATSFLQTVGLDVRQPSLAS